jgi:hypothetical protein
MHHQRQSIGHKTMAAGYRFAYGGMLLVRKTHPAVRIASSRPRPESINFKSFLTPAFAGVTALGTIYAPISA